MTVVRVRRKARWKLAIRVDLVDGSQIEEEAIIRADSLDDLIEGREIDSAMNDATFEALEANVEQDDIVGLTFSVRKVGP